MTRQRLKAAFLFISAFAGTLLLFEALFVVGYFIADGEYLAVSEKMAREGSAFLNSGPCNYVETLAPHPFLAFVHHGNPPCGTEDINQQGFYGRDFPLSRNEDEFAILLLGGSVATQFGMSGFLEGVLNSEYSKDGKPFVVYNGALQAWKHPQQLITLALYGDAVDGIVSIEGWNELMMTRRDGYRNRIEKAWAPSYSEVIGEEYLDESALFVWAGLKLFDLTRDHWLLSHSKLFYFASSRIRQSLRNAIAAESDSEVLTNELRQQTIETLFLLPEEWEVSQRQEWNMRKYESYLRAMTALARSKQLDTAVFIQPVPAIDKPLTEEERAAVGGLGYADEYRQLNQDLLELRDEGIPIFSLSDLYSTYTETLYIDNIHQEIDSEGYRMMAERIAGQIAEVWNLDPVD